MSLNSDKVKQIKIIYILNIDRMEYKFQEKLDEYNGVKNKLSDEFKNELVNNTSFEFNAGCLNLNVSILETPVTIIVEGNEIQYNCAVPGMNWRGIKFTTEEDFLRIMSDLVDNLRRIILK